LHGYKGKSVTLAMTGDGLSLLVITIFIPNWALVGETERKKCKKLQFSAWENHGSDRSGKRGRALGLSSPRPGGKSGVPPS